MKKGDKARVLEKKGISKDYHNCIITIGKIIFEHTRLVDGFLKEVILFMAEDLPPDIDPWGNTFTSGLLTSEDIELLTLQ